MATFDTHEVIKELMLGGLQEKTAEVIVKAIRESKDRGLNSLASKAQVALLEQDVENIMQNSASKTDLAGVKTEIANVRTELKTEIHNSEKRLMLMMGGAVVAICSIIIGVLKYL